MIQVWWYCFHSQTSCITDIRWWQHAYVDPQRSWSKCCLSCFLSSRDVTICNICWSYHCYDSKLSIRHGHQLLAALCLSLCQKLKTIWNFLLGSSYRILCLVEKAYWYSIRFTERIQSVHKNPVSIRVVNDILYIIIQFVRNRKKSNGKQIWQ